MFPTLTTDQTKANLRELVEQLKAKDWNAPLAPFNGSTPSPAVQQRYAESCAFLDAWLQVAFSELDAIEAKTRALADSQAAIEAALQSGNLAEAQRLAAEIFPQLAADMLAKS